MEALAVLLEPYKNLITTGASVATYCHQLSGAVICNDIRKKKSTAGMSAMPFVAGIVISTLVIRFGMVLNDDVTVRVNFLGLALNVAYLCCYYMYTNDVKEKTLVWAQTGYAGAFIAVVWAYTVMENPANLPFRYGVLLTAVLFYVVGSPLLSLGEIIRRKSTEGLPFPIILTGTTISLLWFLYGIVAREGFIVFQNGTIFLMSAIQLSLFAIYPSKSKGSPKSSPKKNNNNNKKKN